MKKKTLIGLLVVALIVLAAPSALAWQEGGGDNWYYVDASYGGDHNSVPLVIEINGNPSDGQTLNVGSTVAISGDLHAYATMCAESGNVAFTDAALEVDGPSGSGSDMAGAYNSNSNDCAEVETIDTLTIAYLLTDLGTHTVYMHSHAAAASGNAGLDVNDFAEDWLTFEVVPGVVVIDGCDTGVVDNGTISDSIAQCAADARNHGQFVRCVAHLANDLVGAGDITGREKGAIQRCAARSDIP